MKLYLKNKWKYLIGLEKWLYKAYGKYGERFAEWLDGKERTHKIIRKWMDKRIKKYLDTKPKTAQEIGPC